MLANSVPLRRMSARIQQLRLSVSKPLRVQLAKIVTRGQATVRSPVGEEKELQTTMSIGSSSSCDITIGGPNVLPVHAEIFRKSGRVFCRALGGDPDDFKSHSSTWLATSELRAGVDYILSPGTELFFGEASANKVVVNFEEGSEDSGAMAQMMMGAMAQGASSEVRDRMSS